MPGSLLLQGRGPVIACGLQPARQALLKESWLKAPCFNKEKASSPCGNASGRYCQQICAQAAVCRRKERHSTNSLCCDLLRSLTRLGRMGHSKKLNEPNYPLHTLVPGFFANTMARSCTQSPTKAGLMVGWCPQPLAS